MLKINQAEDSNSHGLAERPTADEVGDGLIDFTEIIKFTKRNRDIGKAALGFLGYIPREVRDTLHSLRH